MSCTGAALQRRQKTNIFGSICSIKILISLLTKLKSTIWRMTALLAIQLDYTGSFNASCEGAAGLVAAYFHPEQASPSAGLLEAKLCRRVLLPLERHLEDFTCTPLYVYFYSLLVRSLLRHLEKHFPEGVSVFK